MPILMILGSEDVVCCGIAFSSMFIAINSAATLRPDIIRRDLFPCERSLAAMPLSAANVVEVTCSQGDVRPGTSRFVSV